MNRSSRIRHTHRALRRPSLRAGSFLSSCIALILMAHAPLALTQVAQPPSEAEIRAAFILNFAKFTEWPAEAFGNADAPLTVGFVGTDDTRSAFATLSGGKVINGRKIVAIHLESVLNARQCQILFFRKDKGDFATGALEVAADASALTIGESENFLSRGGMIRLFVEDNKLRFDINVGAAHRSKILLSSKLLALAHTVVNLPLPGGD